MAKLTDFDRKKLSQNRLAQPRFYGKSSRLIPTQYHGFQDVAQPHMLRKTGVRNPGLFVVLTPFPRMLAAGRSDPLIWLKLNRKFRSKKYQCNP